MSYVCEKSVGAERSCDFRSGKVILQQPIEAGQMSKLLTAGRTDLLEGFVSSRTRRRFKAFLVRQPDGKVGFEFQAATARGPRKGATDATAATSSDGDAVAVAVAADGNGEASANVPSASTRKVKAKAGSKAAATAVAATGSTAKKPAGTRAASAPAAKKPAAKRRTTKG